MQGKQVGVNVMDAWPYKSRRRFRLQIIIVKSLSARPLKVDICPDLDVISTRYVCHIARRRSAPIEWSCKLKIPSARPWTMSGSDTYRSCGPILTIRTVRAGATLDRIDAFFRSGRREE